MKKVLLLIVTIILIGIGIKSIFFDEFNQNGIYLKLSTDDEWSSHQRLNAFAIKIKSQLDKEDIVYDYMKVEDNKLIFENLDEGDSEKIAKILQNYNAIFNIKRDGFTYSFSFSSSYLKKEKAKSLESAKKILEKRLEQAGLYNRMFDIFLSEKLTIEISENKFIEITIPKLCKKCPELRVNQWIGSVGYFSLMPVNDNDEVNESDIPIIDSSMLKKVSMAFKDKKPQLNISVTNSGKKILADYTTTHILNKVAIVIDAKVYSLPRITDGIVNGSFVVDIEELSVVEVYDLVLIINNGALLSSFQVETKKSINWGDKKETIN